jgi:DNA-binding MarR family transcriptional regulator
MSSPPLDDRGVFLLSQIGYHVSYRFMAQLAPLGLLPAHFGILSHLAAADGRSQQELADLLGVHRNAMVGLVDELEERELVRRRPHPADRRAHAVHLTDRAHTALAGAESEADGIEAEILAPLDDAERDQLRSLLQRVAGHAGLPPGVHPGLQRRRRSQAQGPAARRPTRGHSDE